MRVLDRISIGHGGGVFYAALFSLAASGLIWSSILAGVYAQESIPSPPPSAVERKNLAPVSRDILRVKLPRPMEAKLSNGITVLILEDRRFPLVFAQLRIGGAGALFEPAHLSGLANVTAQMLREGTRSRSSKQIAEESDRLGATLGAFADFGSTETSFSASGLKDNFDDWFALAVDVLLRPSFPADELDKLKQRLRVQLRQQRASPSFLASERFNRIVFGAHPAAIVSPTPASVEALTSAALADWHRQRYAPQNTIVGIAGHVRAAEVMPKLEKWFSGWKKNNAKHELPPPPAPAKASHVSLIDRPNSVQTTLTLGNIAIDRRSPDYFAMVVMNRILGGGPAARLFLNLREEKGYSYGVYSNFTAVQYPGPWRAGGNMRTEVTAPSVEEFFNEIRRMRDEKVSAAELEENKRALAASFALSLEQPTQILGFAITSKVYGFPSNYWDSYPAKIMAVSAEDVQRVARKYLNPATMQIVAVGDANRIKAAFEKYGAVEVYDGEGRPSPSPKP